MSLDPFTAGFDLVKTGLDKFFPDANLETKGKLDAAASAIANEYALTLGQIKINEVEAANPSWFVAGARPAAMWVGVLTLLYSGLGISLLNWAAAASGLPLFPIIDPTAANNILMGLLGLGAARTAEKIKGVETKKVGR